MRHRPALLATVVAILALLGLPAEAARADRPVAPDGAPVVLRGTVVVPDGVIRHGYVVVDDGRIVEVAEHEPQVPGAVKVNTRGVIYPGLVDVHNHLPYNVFPRWTPSATYTNRSQWRADPSYRSRVATPFANLRRTRLCDMNAYGEIRALVGGTTTAMTTQPSACIAGLVRNLDWNSGFYGTTELNRERVISELEVPPPTAPGPRAAFAAQARAAIADPRWEGLFLHLAEGVDAAAAEEFDFLVAQGLVSDKGNLVHGTALDAADFAAMAAAGAGLVWSPRSNLELYGTTTDVGAALDAGVEVSLAPDWAVTGSSNVLDELRVASTWNRDHLGGRLSDEDLVSMVTSVPARQAGIDDEVGAIAPGLRADLLVVDGDHNDPYGALVDARPADVELVMVAGEPVYGDDDLMARFWGPGDRQDLVVDGDEHAIRLPATMGALGDLVARLEAALAAQGQVLAPLTE